MVQAMTAQGSLMATAQTRPVSIHRDRSGTDLSSQLQQQIQRCLSQAEAAAQQGEIATSARLILEALDCERRLASRGPQVLQLIKPRD